jgi:hypothetical protein
MRMMRKKKSGIWKSTGMPHEQEEDLKAENQII